MPGTQTRFWCFTLNNPTDEELGVIRLVDVDGEQKQLIRRKTGNGGTFSSEQSAADSSSSETDTGGGLEPERQQFEETYGDPKVPVTFICWQLERGSCLHAQGYVEFLNRQTTKGCKLFLHRAHFEPRRGTAEQAAGYCEKLLTSIGQENHKYGTLSKQGHRSDLAAVSERIKAGDSKKRIAETHPDVFIKYSKGISELISVLRRPEPTQNRDLVVHVFYGATGRGKTLHAINYMASRWSNNFYIWRPPEKTGEPLWWDGYDFEPGIIIDEFNGNGIGYRSLLGLLDRYFLRLAIKTSFTYAGFTEVIITSDKSPDQWYTNEANTTELMRRLNGARIDYDHPAFDRKDPNFIPLLSVEGVYINL